MIFKERKWETDEKWSVLPSTDRNMYENLDAVAEQDFNPDMVILYGHDAYDEGMKNAKYLWNKLSSSDQKRAQIRAREKYEMDKKSEIYCAREEGKEEGMKEGLEKGIKEGLEKGIQEGLEKGIQEGEKRKMKELILNMSNQGLDDEFIAKCLNIDINTLKQLLNN